MWNSFTTALSFLTIFRLPFVTSQTVSSQELAKSFSFFPLVGMLLGACWLAPAYFLSNSMPPLLLAVFMTSLMAVLTRALHLDGLADLADGAGGGYTPERRLEIMKDSRTGAFGALALILAVFFKVVALQAIIENSNWPPLLLIPALSRFAIVLAAYKSPYARKEGSLGRLFIEHMTSREIATATILTISLSALIPFQHALLYMASVLACVGVLRYLAGKWLGGITGDVLGAANELSEISLLSIAACLAPH